MVILLLRNPLDDLSGAVGAPNQKWIWPTHRGVLAWLNCMVLVQLSIHLFETKRARAGFSTASNVLRD
jgi:hypothetical protein